MSPTGLPSAPDPLEDELAELVRSAQQDIEKVPGMEEDAGELIEDSDSFTFVMMAPGYAVRDVHVTLDVFTLTVETRDFRVNRALRSPVDPASARSTYLNGVLSVRVDKKA
jgi:HSP20 family molecular chaperone IbpA